MRRGEAYPSQYLKQDDVHDEPRVFEIEDVRKITITGDRGPEEVPVMHFKDEEKKLIVIPTNWDVIEEAYGPESDGWAGRRVELYRDASVSYGGKRTGGLRLRIPQGAKAPRAGKPAATGATTMTWDEALAAAYHAGMSAEELKAQLKAQGITAWNAIKHTPLAKALIMDWKRQANAVSEAEPEPDSDGLDDIPF